VRDAGFEDFVICKISSIDIFFDRFLYKQPDIAKREGFAAVDAAAI